jgi:hypothetical protein
MKIAQEIRAGNVIMQGKDPWVVLKTEYSRGGRNAATVRMKMKNLLNGGGAEVRKLWQAWNGLGPWPAALPDAIAWRQACQQWRSGLLEQSDLTSQLMQFVAAKR